MCDFFMNIHGGLWYDISFAGAWLWRVHASPLCPLVWRLASGSPAHQPDWNMAELLRLGRAVCCSKKRLVLQEGITSFRMYDWAKALGMFCYRPRQQMNPWPLAWGAWLCLSCSWALDLSSQFWLLWLSVVKDKDDVGKRPNICGLELRKMKLKMKMIFLQNRVVFQRFFAHSIAYYSTYVAYIQVPQFFK